MGGDGGSIPRREELVRTKQRTEQVGREAGIAAKWFHCQISQDRLCRPIVACQLGRFYNKTALLEYLLEGTKKESFCHIRGKRDFRVLNLTDSPAHNNKEHKFGDLATAPFACPVTGIEMNGRFKFYFPWKCGCVFSDKALSLVGTTSKDCPSCHAPDALSDLILLNPATDKEVSEATARMKERKESSRSMEKKQKSASTSQVSREAPSLKRKAVDSSAASSSNPKQSKSIQSDPSTSAAFKALFTSSKEAKNQPKPHWVTFNPGYFR